MSVDSWMDKVVVHIYNGILLSHFLKMNLSQWDGEGFPSGSAIKNLPAGDVSSTPGLGRSPRGWHDNPLQYSFLENFMDRGACWATVHGVAKSWTWLRQISMHAHSEVDEPRGYYTEWSKSEREKILYINVCAYIESRKMVQMNLITGKEQRCRHRELTCGHSGGGRGWDELRE